MNIRPNVAEVAARAANELRDELFRKAVEAEKARLLAPPPSIWQRLVNLLPFTITMKRKSK